MHPEVAVVDVANRIDMAHHAVRAEVNTSSKSDRIPGIPIRQAIIADSQPAQRTANNQRTAENARPPARRAEPRLAREWGQVRESDDPMAIAAFAARHPEASESRLARSKLIGLIETADDVALLNILGLGTGDIAERAQQRLSRLHETTNAREDAARTAVDNLNERAASFVSARVTGWSSGNGVNLASHANAYADEVVYNGSRKSKQAIVREKRHLLELWPERSYEVRPDSVTVRCLASVCKVGGLVDWRGGLRARQLPHSEREQHGTEASPTGGFVHNQRQQRQGNHVHGNDVADHQRRPSGRRALLAGREPNVAVQAQDRPTGASASAAAGAGATGSGGTDPGHHLR